jgi:hypothetical protein
VTGIREAERRLWEPTCCPLCGAPRDFDGTWVEVTTYSDPEPEYLPGRVWCSTPKCGQVCKLCRREPGDVHGPDCGPLMFGKVERPHIVDASDCR